jgi:hypothetical protein
MFVLLSAAKAGDGSFYIAKFLDRLCMSSSTASKYVHSTCSTLHANAEEEMVDTDKADTK